MHIKFSPQRRDGVLEIIKNGDKLRINGDLFSFVSLPDGATIPSGAVPCEWIVGPVERIDGKIHLTLILPHGPTPSRKVAFPAAIESVPDGAVAIPAEPKTSVPVISQTEAADVDA